MTAPVQTQLSDQYVERILKTLKQWTSSDVTALVDKRFEELRKELREQATNRGQQLIAAATGSAEPEAPQQKGLAAAQFLRVVAACGREKLSFRDHGPRVAAEIFGRNSRIVGLVEKTLAATTGTAGGVLIPEEVAGEVIEYLRAASAVRQLNPAVVPMDTGVLNLPKITGGAQASYIGENTNAPKTTLTFGNVRPTAKKLAALVPISNDLIRRRGPAVDTMVRDDLVAALAEKSDSAFIRSAGVNGEPKGLLHWAPSGNKFNANSVVNAANVVKDLGKAIEKLASGNVRFIRPGWIFSHRTYVFLLTLLDANNNFLLREEVSRGTLFGYPFARTSNVPNNLGTGGDESEVYFADFADVVIAESTNIMLDASSEAAYFDGTNVIAAFSQDQTVIRAIVEHDLVMRHDESVAVIQAVKWTL